MNAKSRLYGVVVLFCVAACIDFEEQRREFCRHADAERRDLDCGGVFSPCGDGIVQEGEVCDDGNIRDGDGCSADCKSDETCGNGIVDGPVGEVCDDGNTVSGDKCSADCHSAEICGNGILDPGEECDKGGVDTVACDSDCTLPFCGDGHRNAARGEECDDGNLATETSCPYGTRTCTACDSTCSMALSLIGPYCGDGLINGSETCDDGNNLECGSCSTSCTQYHSGPATGTIQATSGSSLWDGETFTINDGINPPAIFEFDQTFGPDAGVSVGHIGVAFRTGDSPGGVARNIMYAIGDAGIQITAISFGAGRVDLTNNQPGSSGNQPITETVGDPYFRVTGMSDGGGYDCLVGDGCVSTADCTPGLTCRGTCQLP